MLRISVLGSGSAGNSAVVFTDQTRLLVDAGLSARQLNLRLEAVGVAPETLDGILITHEHGDHVRGLDVFCRKVEVPLYSNASTREVMVTGPLREPKTWRLITTGGRFSIGDIEVQTFPVAHDATEPMGFTFRDGDSAIGVLSDVGYVTNLMRNHMREMNTVFIEANYDSELLQNDEKRPWSIKQRILSRHGHLSNDQAATLLREIAHDDLHQVILGHLSQDCNEPDIAISVAQAALQQRGQVGVEVLCASQREPTPCLSAVRGGGEAERLPTAVEPSEERMEAEGRLSVDLAPPVLERVSASSWARAASFEQVELFES